MDSMNPYNIRMHSVVLLSTVRAARATRWWWCDGCVTCMLERAPPSVQSKKFHSCVLFFFFFWNMCVEVHGSSRYCNSAVNIRMAMFLRFALFLCCIGRDCGGQAGVAGIGMLVRTKKKIVYRYKRTYGIHGWLALNIEFYFYVILFFSFLFCAFYFGGLIARLMRMQVLVIVWVYGFRCVYGAHIFWAIRLNVFEWIAYM